LDGCKGIEGNWYMGIWNRGIMEKWNNVPFEKKRDVPAYFGASAKNAPE